ncbi:claudin-8 [Hippocampus zosterae]|uniref:claudin-8 n=1 Tax=Hippocampus zosterae TaxID=109293 RepID=UPI00223E5F8D|nr:claudin-8 [Hippocampus zosterae]
MRPRPPAGRAPFPSQSPLQSRRERDKMADSALEMLGFFLTLIGLIGVAASTGMPMWRVTAFIGENIIVFETRYEGLWMNCFKQADIRMQCKVYDSLLALPPDLQAARGLMCCSLALAGLALLISLAGLQCTACIRNNDRAKRLVLIVAGAVIFTACICVLIPVSWTAHVIIRDFYNPLLIDAQRRELGEALYIGWVAGAFLFAGGCVFTCCNVRSEGKEPRGYVYSGNSDYMAYPPQPVRTLQPQQLVLLPQAQAQPILSRHPSAQSQPVLSRHPSAQAQPVLSRHPSSIYSYQSSQTSRYPSVRSGVAYL